MSLPTTRQCREPAPPMSSAWTRPRSTSFESTQSLAVVPSMLGTRTPNSSAVEPMVRGRPR
jgi:hypothetical protein